MKIKETINFVGLSYQTEIIKITIINIIGFALAAVLFFLLDQIVWAIIAILGLFLLDYYLLTSYQDKKNIILKERENELVTIISYFEVYIENKNNVYQSFNLLLPYCSLWMKEKIENMLKEIDKDKSVQPFVNFAKNFQQVAFSSLMLSIYQMVDQGENSSQLNQFNATFDELAKNRDKEMMEQKEKSLTNMSTFPLVGAGLITISLTISILSVLGELVNVI
ncbi:MAG TPA: hypothetical protein GX010_03900 [Erysipelotrichaceae bacterium]|nr:hypothetical protein [Erysipelotrichaceae bacterium]